MNISIFKKELKTLRGWKENMQIGESLLGIIDCSASMWDSDYPPSRLDAAKESFQELLDIKCERSPGDMVGLIGFNSKAKIFCRLVPVVSGRKYLTKALSMLYPDNGTDLASGLEMAWRVFFGGFSTVCTTGITKNSASHRAQRRIVLLTDGHGGYPEEIADRLKKNFVVLDIVGIGGSRAAVNERLLKSIASFIDDKLHYRFIKDKEKLITHFRSLATGIVK